MQVRDRDKGDADPLHAQPDIDGGLASAAQWQLTPGTALTAAQMAALTHDMVWLVSQAVTLPDGSTQRVFVPVVYLARGEAGDAGKVA